MAEVWVVYADHRHVVVTTAAGNRLFRAGDELTTPLLPGWSCPVRSLFPAC